MINHQKVCGGAPRQGERREGVRGTMENFQRRTSPDIDVLAPLRRVMAAQEGTCGLKNGPGTIIHATLSGEWQAFRHKYGQTSEGLRRSVIWRKDVLTCGRVSCQVKSSLNSPAHLEYPAHPVLPTEMSS